MGTEVQFRKLFEPGQIGRVKIRSRIVMSPCGTSFWGPNGEVTEKIMDHYVARAKGGAGLITVSSAAIDYPPGYAYLGRLDRFPLVAGHYELTEALHVYGAKVSLQLQHRGRQQAIVAPGMQLVSSSPVPCILLGQSAYPIPRQLEKGEIYQIIDLFAAVAANAKRAGYDMVELHGAHGYLINSFMSPYLNKRMDEFGGSLENRMRFPLELIRRIKEKVGDDFPVGIRISADEFLDGGITTEESSSMAKILEKGGAAFIHVSSGTYENLHKSNDITRLPEGWKSYIWAAVKKAVTIPTFAAGGLKTPELCESILAQGKADFVALGRPLFADPEWPNKAAEGRVEDIRKCISCMECLGTMTGRAGASRCAINPAVGREKEFAKVESATRSKNVMVIGAGPGGMEAARRLALRGHRVTLYDEKREIGGQLLIAAKPPGKEKLSWLKDYYTTQLRKLNVELRLGSEVTPTVVEKAKPDAVIVATGAEPLIPDILGITSEKVVTASDVLGGKVEVRNQRVAIAGGGMVGAETAEFLADQSNQVTVVEMLPDIASDMEPLNRKGLMDALREKNVTLLTRQEITEIVAGGVVTLDKGSGQSQLIEADMVVLAMGVKPVRDLVNALVGKVPQLYAIGDCQEPRTIMAAIYEGAVATREI